MRQVFIDLILEEKQRGKTILMSSHIFTEIERTCDRVAIIKDGRLVTVENIHDLQSMRRQVIDVTVSSQEEIESLTKCNLQFEAVKGREASIIVQRKLSNCFTNTFKLQCNGTSNESDGFRTFIYALLR